MPLVRGYLEILGPSGGQPEHPWIPPGPGQPPASGHPSHPIYWPGAHPEHPWIPPGETPPSQGAPGYPTHPWIPPYGPSHPIVIPPGETPPEPGNGLTPTHPIVIPPPASSGGETQKALVFAVVPGVGGVWFLIETPVPPPPTQAQPKG